MRICYIADGTSPHVRGFLRNLTAITQQHEVMAVSTRFCPDSSIGAARVKNVTAYPGMGGASPSRYVSVLKHIYVSVTDPQAISLLAGLAYYLDYLRVVRRVRRVVDAFRPDVIHGIRLQLEGALASAMGWRPTVVTIWGHEFVLYARNSALLRRLSNKALKSADLVVADNDRDARLSLQFGSRPHVPSLVMPAQGGVNRSVFRPVDRRAAKSALRLDPNRPLVVSVRGFLNAIMRTDMLIRAMPLVLSRAPEVQFLIHGGTKPGGVTRLSSLAESLAVHTSVQFSSRPLSSVAQYLQAADVMVSVATFDGVPMSMMEAMACDCVPVMSKTDAIGEWIEHGQNGFLFDPRNPDDLADALLSALRCPVRRVIEINRNLIAHRANPEQNLSRLLSLYSRLTL